MSAPAMGGVWSGSGFVLPANGMGGIMSACSFGTGGGFFVHLGKNTWDFFSGGCTIVLQSYFCAYRNDVAMSSNLKIAKCEII